MVGSAPKKVLIVGPAWVGDMVMAQTLFKLLKSEHPGLLIDVLAPPWTVPLLERMPEVHQAIESPFRHGAFRLLERYRLGKRLREAQYDWSITLPRAWKAALVPFFARIPRRTGWRGEWRYGLLNDIRSLNKKDLPLMIQRFMALALPRGSALPSDPSLPRFSTSISSVDETLARLSLLRPDQPVLALCPGAEFGPAKRWPEHYYAEVAKAKLDAGWAVWLFGSAKDQDVAAAIQEQTDGACLDLTGRTKLGEAIDLMSLATVVVSNDSGLMHVAAALDRPIVALYGSTSPGFTPPLSDKVSIVRTGIECSPCFKRECPLKHFECMKSLFPKQVQQAVDALYTQHY